MSKDTLLGIFIMLLGSLSLAIMGTFVKLIGTHVDEAFVLFSRFIISLICVCPLAFKEYKQGLRIRNWGMLIARSLIGLIAMASYFYAIHHMPLAEACLLLSTAPAFVPLVLLVLFGVRTHKSVYFGIFVCLVGVTFIIRPGSGFFHWPALVAALAGFGAAVATVLLRRIMSNGQNGAALALFVYFAITSFVALGFSFDNWKTPSHTDWLYLLMVGIFGFLFQLALAHATRLTQIRIISPTGLTTVIFAGIISWIFFDEVPTLLSFVGAAVVLTGVCIVAICSSSKN